MTMQRRTLLTSALLAASCALALPVKVEDLAPKPPDKDKLAELFARLEFKTWLRELQGDTPWLDVPIDGR